MTTTATRSRRRRRGWHKPDLERVPAWKPLPDWLCRAALRGVHTGKQRLRVDVEDNVIKLVQAVQRWAYDTGNGAGYTTNMQLAQALYGRDIIQTEEDWMKKQGSLLRWRQRAADAGLVSIEPVTEEQTGAYVCLRWRLLDPLVDSCDPAGVAQSVRAAES